MLLPLHLDPVLRQILEPLLVEAVLVNYYYETEPLVSTLLHQLKHLDQVNNQNRFSKTHRQLQKYLPVRPEFRVHFDENARLLLRQFHVASV